MKIYKNIDKSDFCIYFFYTFTNYKKEAVMITRALEQEIINRIKANYKVREAILFGSYADGEPHCDSDIDLVIILDENYKAKKYSEILERRVKLSKLLIDIERKTPLDILVYTSAEWEELVKTGSSFINEISARGRRIA